MSPEAAFKFLLSVGIPASDEEVSELTREDLDRYGVRLISKAELACVGLAMGLKDEAIEDMIADWESGATATGQGK